jgi:hypothetical protein
MPEGAAHLPFEFSWKQSCVQTILNVCRKAHSCWNDGADERAVRDDRDPVALAIGQTRRALRGEADQLSEELASLREQFADYEQIHAVFFGPLSHHLLDMYKNERCAFEDMILAMCLIERLVHDDSHFDDAVNQDGRRKYP